MHCACTAIEGISMDSALLCLMHSGFCLLRCRLRLHRYLICSLLYYLATKLFTTTFASIKSCLEYLVPTTYPCPADIVVCFFYYYKTYVEMRISAHMTSNYKLGYFGSSIRVVTSNLNQCGRFVVTAK